MGDQSLDSPFPPDGSGAECPVCGGSGFTRNTVLWPELISSWGLDAVEAAYVNEQQGTVCAGCGANIRSMALARAICQSRGYTGNLDSFLAESANAGLSVLEVNEAGNLHSRLQRLAGHTFAQYPQIDMMSLPFEHGSFDLVVHSDTLEHVADPLKALLESRMALRHGGALVFTVPIIVGRLTRSRVGLPPSYHGAEKTRQNDLLVHTEFGADVWSYIMEAGFSRCEFVTFRYPAGIAIVARK